MNEVIELNMNIFSVIIVLSVILTQSRIEDRHKQLKDILGERYDAPKSNCFPYSNNEKKSKKRHYRKFGNPNSPEL